MCLSNCSRGVMEYINYKMGSLRDNTGVQQNAIFSGKLHAMDEKQSTIYVQKYAVYHRVHTYLDCRIIVVLLIYISCNPASKSHIICRLLAHAKCLRMHIIIICIHVVDYDVRIFSHMVL